MSLPDDRRGTARARRDRRDDARSRKPGHLAMAVPAQAADLAHCAEAHGQIWAPAARGGPPRRTSSRNHGEPRRARARDGDRAPM